MTKDLNPPDQRDRTVQRVGRLRRTLIGVAAAASLAVTGIVGLNATHHGSSGTAAATGSGTTSGSGSTTTSGSPTLTTGSGAANASTSGS